MYDNLDARTGDLVWTDLCRGPHLPRTSTIPAFSLTRQRGRLLARQREEPAAPARVRHRLGEQGRPQGLPGAAGRGRAPRPPPARRRARPLQLPRRDRLRPGRLPPQGRGDQAGDGGLRPRAGTSRRASTTSARRTSARAGCSRPPGTCRTTRTPCSRPMDLENAKYYLKAMNCPMHNLIFRSRGRSYRELPLRFFEFGSVYRYEKSGVVHGLTRVRGLTQDDSHSYVTPEQAPGRDPAPARVRARPAPRLRPRRLLPGALHPGRPGASSSAPRRSGRSRPPSSRTPPRRPGWSSSPDPGGAAFYGPKISVQAARRHRPHLADVDHPVRLQPAGPLRPGVHRGRRQPAAAGDDPLGEVRLHRAVLRRPHRALRRRVPGLAGAGAGGRHPDHRRAGAAT